MSAGETGGIEVGGVEPDAPQSVQRLTNRDRRQTSDGAVAECDRRPEVRKAADMHDPRGRRTSLQDAASSGRSEGKWTRKGQPGSFRSVVETQNHAVFQCYRGSGSSGLLRGKITFP
jgi:hypothetical protein